MADDKETLEIKNKIIKADSNILDLEKKIVDIIRKNKVESKGLLATLAKITKQSQEVGDEHQEWLKCDS